jgi:predicted Zn-dependent protease
VNEARQLLKKRRLIALLLILSALLLSCSTVPVTGRRQLNLVPTSSLNSMSFQQYSEFISSHKLSDDVEATQMVRRVGNRIKEAAERYLTQQGAAGALKGYSWEFNLVEDSLINAWCMPGGKVVVYTGILPVTQDETGLAVVMGHEIAHAGANHGNERMSQGLLAMMGSVALSEALKEKPKETRDLFMSAYGIGAQVGVILPYSRLHESEADHMGLIFMAMAGYDPRAATDFWQRMASLNEGTAPPEFLSTHPSDEKRIGKIRELIPEAMRYYQTP